MNMLYYTHPLKLLYMTSWPESLKTLNFQDGPVVCVCWPASTCSFRRSDGDAGNDNNECQSPYHSGTTYWFKRVTNSFRLSSATEPPPPPITTTLSPLAWMTALTEVHRDDLAITTIPSGPNINPHKYLCNHKMSNRQEKFRLPGLSYWHRNSTYTLLYPARLADSTKNFAVLVLRKPTILSCWSFGLCGVIRFDCKAWKLTYTLTKNKVRLPTYIVLPVWKVRSLNRLLQSPDYMISPL